MTIETGNSRFAGEESGNHKPWSRTTESEKRQSIRKVYDPAISASRLA